MNALRIFPLKLSKPDRRALDKLAHDSALTRADVLRLMIRRASAGELSQWRVKWRTMELAYITALPIGKELRIKFYRMPWNVPRKRVVVKDNSGAEWESADSVLTVEYRAKLRQNLAEHFSKDELRTLCFDLGIKYENFPEALDGMAREIVAYCERSGHIPQLLAYCLKLRPKVSWSEGS